MKDRIVYRMRDILDAITQIERLLHAKTFENVRSERLVRAAFERFLEIISEASRHIPQELKVQAPDIPGHATRTSATTCVTPTIGWTPSFSGICTRKATSRL